MSEAEITKKIKVLTIPSDSFGTGHFRCIWPAQAITKLFDGEFDMEINMYPNIENIEYFKQFDIIHFHRHIGHPDTYKTLLPRLKQEGIVLIMDIDDYWVPPVAHPLYQIVMKDKLTEKILETIKFVDYVTTTTPIFAEYISKYNKNVKVLVNGINTEEKMWASECAPNESGKVRIGWLGGSSHLADLEILKQSMALLHGNKELENKFQIVMSGFDTRGSMTEISPDGKGGEVQKNRPIRPEETVWNNFERILTNNYSALNEDPEYLKWLLKISKDDYPDQYKKNYVRRWTLPLTQYAKHYDYYDICIAPLADIEEHVSEKGQVTKVPNYFNIVKSELKFVEAGMKKKVLIAQDFGIHGRIIEDGVTGILIKNDDPKGWYKALRKLILEPEYRKKLANNIHEAVKDKYNIDTVAKTRADFYKEILAKKKLKPAISITIEQPKEIQQVVSQSVIDSNLIKI